METPKKTYSHIKQPEHENIFKELEDLEAYIVEAGSSNILQNDDYTGFFKLFINQILIFILHLKQDYADLIKTNQLSSIYHYFDRLNINPSYEYFEKTSLLMLKRYFYTELIATLEESTKNYVNSKKLEISETIPHNKKSCDYDGCCFNDQKTKPRNLSYLIDKIFSDKCLGDNDTKKKWSSLFKALTIIRNRTGHSNRLLEEHEINNLKKHPNLFKDLCDAKIRIDIKNIQYAVEITFKFYVYLREQELSLSLEKVFINE